MVSKLPPSIGMLPGKFPGTGSRCDDSDGCPPTRAFANRAEQPWLFVSRPFTSLASRAASLPDRATAHFNKTARVVLRKHDEASKAARSVAKPRHCVAMCFPAKPDHCRKREGSQGAKLRARSTDGVVYQCNVNRRRWRRADRRFSSSSMRVIER